MIKPQKFWINKRVYNHFLFGIPVVFHTVKPENPKYYIEISCSSIDDIEMDQTLEGPWNVKRVLKEEKKK